MAIQSISIQGRYPSPNHPTLKTAIKQFQKICHFLGGSWGGHLNTYGLRWYLLF